MTYAIVSLMLNIFVSLLLGVTILYCLKLNRRIRILQDSKSELAHLIEKFDQSTQQATYSIQEIHKASKKINENIQTKLDKANYLADDLAFMIEKANKMADRMEAGVTGKPGTRAAATGPEPRQRPAAPRPEVLAEAMESADSAAPRAARRGEAAPAAGGKPLDSMMERLSELKGGKQPGAAAAAGGRRLNVRPRSRSEQELMEALKTESKV